MKTVLKMISFDEWLQIETFHLLIVSLSNYFSLLNVFLVNCTNVLIGNNGYCACNDCFEYDGDCDFNYHCQNGLRCGSKNCPVSLGFDANTDCCYEAIIGDEDFCTSDDPCESGQGDCDSNDECQDGLFCGSKNCESAPLMDCCRSEGDPLFPTFSFLVQFSYISQFSL